jgi:hypothetical protein
MDVFFHHWTPKTISPLKVTIETIFGNKLGLGAKVSSKSRLIGIIRCAANFHNILLKQKCSAKTYQNIYMVLQFSLWKNPEILPKTRQIR